MRHFGTDEWFSVEKVILFKFHHISNTLLLVLVENIAQTEIRNGGRLNYRFTNHRIRKPESLEILANSKHFPIVISAAFGQI